MIESFSRNAALVVALAGLTAGTTLAQGTTSPQAAAGRQVVAAADGFTRVTESDDGSVVQLELAGQQYLPGGAGGPEVWLVGAVHIADRTFYKELQAFLDSRDIVLFEGVKPPGAGRAEHDLGAQSDEQKATTTRWRIEFLSNLIHRCEDKNGSCPATLDIAVATADARLAAYAKAMEIDGWGRSLLYSVNEADAGAVPRSSFELKSLGSDGQPGGDGPAEDILSSAMPEQTDDGGAGLQKQMAEAFGLVFQLDEMDHSKTSWRNSDLSIDQVQDRLVRAGADPKVLFGMLDGSSFQAKLAGFLLRFISANKLMATTAKLMLLEMLARADELVGSVPGPTGTMMEVLLKDRNAVVLEDLKSTIAEPGVRTIGVIYGAGHMPDLSERLIGTLGYRAGERRWFRAITVNLADLGSSKAQVQQMRAMMRTMLDQQIQAARRQNKPAR